MKLPIVNFCETITFGAGVNCFYLQGLLLGKGWKMISQKKLIIVSRD
jgi:hypothetical protein